MNTLSIKVGLTNQELQTMRDLLGARINAAKVGFITPAEEMQQKQRLKLMRKITSALEDLTNATF